ncbi:Rv1733c family protein [Streptomyces sp. NBC_01477]|uniref:Rv1733c family protein n=1 Tax=Streptomyces sp. NBC_01477 TaxID=2976015 RepID=UPI002E30EED4|nr:hypothetical protein [Streptomyces sp. NBC_01477]
MARRTRLTKRGWRWRRNPLRRRSDVVEAWLGVVTILLFCVAPLAGWWAGQSVDRTLQRVARTQRTERTLVAAAVVQSPAASDATAAPGAAKAAAAAAGADSDPRRGDVLRWIAPDHSLHTAKVPVGLEVWRGNEMLLWTDSTGVLVPPPLDNATATTHAVLAGLATGSAAGGVLLVSRQVLMWRLMRRRMDSWEREWARVGQDWGRAGAGG